MAIVCLMPREKLLVNMRKTFLCPRVVTLVLHLWKANLPKNWTSTDLDREMIVLRNVSYWQPLVQPDYCVSSYILEQYVRSLNTESEGGESVKI